MLNNDKSNVPESFVAIIPVKPGSQARFVSANVARLSEGQIALSLIWRWLNPPSGS